MKCTQVAHTYALHVVLFSVNLGLIKCACHRDAFKGKGLLAPPKPAGWGNAAVHKLATPAGGLKVGTMCQSLRFMQLVQFMDENSWVQSFYVGVHSTVQYTHLPLFLHTGGPGGTAEEEGCSAEASSAAGSENQGACCFASLEIVHIFDSALQEICNLRAFKKQSHCAVLLSKGGCRLQVQKHDAVLSEQAAADDETMFWDYGGPRGSPAKANGAAAAAPGQKINGTGSSGSAKDKQASRGSAGGAQQGKSAEEEPFAGTPMSPEFEVRSCSPPVMTHPFDNVVFCP